jgi:hypothetical protein
MANSLPIHDLFIRKLDTIEEDGEIRLPVLSYNDHLLRRFGYAETVQLEPGPRDTMKIREVADEVWALIYGKVRFIWHDLRSTSPTREQKYDTVCEEPTQVLVPFGVAFGIEALEEPALLLRLASHMEEELVDSRTIPWEPK